MLIVALGLYGLFHTTLTKLDAESAYISGHAGHTAVSDPPLDKSFGIVFWIQSWASLLHPGLLRSIGRYTHAALSNPLPIFISGTIIGLGMRLKGRREAVPAWIRRIGTGAAIFFCAAAVIFAGEAFIYLARLSLNQWWLFLVAGGCFCLLVILFNSEELTEKWMMVVSRSAVFAGLAVLFLLGFYCYAVNRYSSRTAELVREQKHQDRMDYRELVAGHTRSPDFKALLSQAEDLINSDREISLAMARYVFKESSALPPSDSDDADSPEWKTKSFTAVFPPPRYLRNQDRWNDILAKFVDGNTTLQSFDSYLQKCLFGNEDLRGLVPYKTYLDILREERYPRKADLPRTALDAGFDGDIEAMKQQFRLRDFDELNELPPHCEILYTGDEEATAEKAWKTAELLRTTRRFIIPDPKFIPFGIDGKDPGMSLCIFARGDADYRSNILKILEVTELYIPPKDTSKKALDEDLKQFCDMTFTNFDLYSDGRMNQPERQEALERLRTRVRDLSTSDPVSSNRVERLNNEISKLEKQEKVDVDQAPKLNSISQRMRLKRELTTLSEYLEFGKPENHFEIWIVPN
ncbi:hypothetical protein GCM10023212_25690 [Luteolibacter yonseiensis]|nr:hypothetical protein [Luteolibacter yonseiensis]